MTFGAELLKSAVFKHHGRIIRLYSSSVRLLINLWPAKKTYYIKVKPHYLSRSRLLHLLDFLLIAFFHWLCIDIHVYPSKSSELRNNPLTCHNIYQLSLNDREKEYFKSIPQLELKLNYSDSIWSTSIGIRERLSGSKSIYITCSGECSVHPVEAKGLTYL